MHFEDVDLGDAAGPEQPDEREFESVDLISDKTASETNSKKDIVKKLAKLAGVRVSSKDLTELGVGEFRLDEKKTRKDRKAERIGNALGKRFGDATLGEAVKKALSGALGSGIEKNDTVKYKQAIDGLILAEKLEHEASKSLSSLYKMVGEKKPHSKEEVDYEKLKQAHRDKEDDKYQYSYAPEGHIHRANPLLPQTPFDTATQKTLEAKNLAKTLKDEAALALSNDGNFRDFLTETSQATNLLEGEGGSLKKATNAAHQEYQKAFYPIRYKLGQKLGRIASSLSAFRRRTSSRGGPLTPKATPKNQKTKGKIPKEYDRGRFTN